MFYYLCKIVVCVPSPRPSKQSQSQDPSRPLPEAGGRRRRACELVLSAGGGRALVAAPSLYPVLGQQPLSNPHPALTPPPLPLLPRTQHVDLGPVPALRVVQGAAPGRELGPDAAGAGRAPRALAHVLVRRRVRVDLGALGRVERQLVRPLPLSSASTAVHGTRLTEGARRRFPFYHEVKTLVMLWLVLPQIQVRSPSPSHSHPVPH